MRRVRGGALALGPQRYSERFGVQARAKERIAAKLASLVPESGAIGMDASSTLQRLAVSIAGAVIFRVPGGAREAVQAIHVGGQLSGFAWVYEDASAAWQQIYSLIRITIIFAGLAAWSAARMASTTSFGSFWE